MRVTIVATTLAAIALAAPAHAAPVLMSGDWAKEAARPGTTIRC